MDKSKTRAIFRAFVLLLTFLVSSVIYLSGIFTPLANRLSDMILQDGDFQSGNIYIIGIDEHSLDELGPYQTWTRDYMAEAIEMLNHDPELAPAVIGVDVLYIGHSYDDADTHLINATSLNNNVIYGSYLNYDDVLIGDKGDYSIKNKVTLYEEPFDELLAISQDGFVNGFIDDDGIVRHGVVSAVIDDVKTVSSFSYAIAKRIKEITEGDSNIQVPINKNGYWYIDYTDSAGGYDNSFSLSDLIDGEIPVEYFTDSIVLIGPYAEGMMDSYTTAIDHASLMYGVEIHANMIEALISDRFKKEVSSNWMCVIIALVSAGAVCVAFKNKLFYSLLYTAVFTIIYPLTCILIYNGGYVLDVFYIPCFAVFIMLLNIIVHYVYAAMEKRRVENTFKRYVAPEIVNTIMEQGIDSINLGGEAVDCAILFVDIRGFTTMSEILEPEQVVQILNKYLELTSSSIFKFGGTLDKFIGDATMAIFGAPIKMEDYVYKAVCAAWDMVERSYSLSEELEKEFGRSVSFGVGVHCGKAVVGNIGTERRMDYTAIGDTVNTSARLEANAPKNTVYISQNVVDVLGDRIKCESVGNIPLKGKSEDLEIFKLLGV